MTRQNIVSSSHQTRLALQEVPYPGLFFQMPILGKHWFFDRFQSVAMLVDEGLSKAIPGQRLLHFPDQYFCRDTVG